MRFEIHIHLNMQYEKKRRTTENKARRMKRVKRPVGTESLEKSVVGWRNPTL